jgi:hypothetical protein
LLFNGVDGSSAGVDVEGALASSGECATPCSAEGVSGDESLPPDEEDEPSAVPAPVPEPLLGGLDEAAPVDDPDGGECPS